MGLPQIFTFEYKKDELEKLLIEVGFKLSDEKYIYSNDSTDVEVFITEHGFYIHRSGEYFELLGMLVEALGKITEKIIIEDE